MGKSLIIPNADFSANAVDVVNLPLNYYDISSKFSFTGSHAAQMFFIPNPDTDLYPITFPDNTLHYVSSGQFSASDMVDISMYHGKRMLFKTCCFSFTTGHRQTGMVFLDSTKSIDKGHFLFPRKYVAGVYKANNKVYNEISAGHDGPLYNMMTIPSDADYVVFTYYNATNRTTYGDFECYILP